MRLDVTVTSGPVAPGGEVSGVVSVLEGGEVRELTAQLVYAEETADYSGAGVRTPAAPLATGSLKDGQEFQFVVTLPVGALPNQRGRHGKVIWHAVAHADIPGGTDASVAVPFDLTLAPVT